MKLPIPAGPGIPSRRLNVGCGDHPLMHWTNLDASRGVLADVYYDVPPLPYAAGDLDEIYAGHFLEHLTFAKAQEFLAECHRVLTPKGKIGIVVPDMRAVMSRYVNRRSATVEFPAGTFRDVSELNHINDLFIFSTAQDSPHQWTYDEETLAELMESAGFIVTARIDRYKDPRITVPNWYSCGWDAVKGDRA